MCATSVIVIGAPRPIANCRFFGSSFTPSPRPVRDDEVVDDPAAVALRPHVVVAERLGDLEEPVLRDADPGAELLDVRVWCLVAAGAQDLDGVRARHPAVA